MFLTSCLTDLNNFTCNILCKVKKKQANNLEFASNINPLISYNSSACRSKETPKRI